MPGLRREKVAFLAGVSVDYYSRLEQRTLSGSSDAVIANALQLDEAERSHLFDLARVARSAKHPRRREPRARVSQSVVQVIESMTTAAAFVWNGRLDGFGA